MELKEFLERNPLINVAKLAYLMWPDVKSAPSRLNNKLKENTAGNGKQRITERDHERAKEVLKALINDINKL